MAPLIRSSLAPAGHTPVLRHQAKHRQKVSLAAALCRSPQRGHVRMIYEVFPDAYVNDLLYADFLRQTLLAQVRGPVILIHDGAALHRGEWMEDLMDDVNRLEVHELPPYAPELNVVEQLWNWTKDKKLVNFASEDVNQLASAALYLMETAARDQHRLQSFYDACSLPW